MRAICLIIIAQSIVASSYGQTNLELSDSLPDADQVYVFVDQNPEFPGGDEALLQFIYKNLRYPEKERDCDIQGKVLLQLVVDVDGSVKKVIVVRSFGKEKDKEAVRVAKMLPKFKPGYKNGKAVKVYFNLPVVFRLQ